LKPKAQKTAGMTFRSFGPPSGAREILERFVVALDNNGFECGGGQHWLSRR
jgi:hypothetical protein